MFYTYFTCFIGVYLHIEMSSFSFWLSASGEISPFLHHQNGSFLSEAFHWLALLVRSERLLVVLFSASFDWSIICRDFKCSRLLTFSFWNFKKFQFSLCRAHTTSISVWFRIFDFLFHVAFCLRAICHPCPRNPFQWCFSIPTITRSPSVC